MNIVFCTTCKGRLQHLQKTLPKNLADNPEARIVVLSYNDQDGLAEWLKTAHAQDIESGRLVVYEYKESVPFRMAHAKNMAHRCGAMEGGDILVNMDADNYAEPGFAKYVAKHFERDNIFLWSRMIKGGKMPRGISGRIAMTRHAFMLAGGYDEKYLTHSPDDKDLNARLRRLGFDAVEIEAPYLKAILHCDKMRYKEYPHAAAQSNQEDSYYISREVTVVNNGNVGCGLVWRNFASEPIAIKPFPTRIWGIGMHKTATTSLHTALKKLGIKSAHWQTAHWAKAVYREMNNGGRSPTLERFYAACDLPITLLFRQLDVAYPGSKFILTFREETNWLTSVRKHWSPKHNQFREQWDSDAFSHRIHEVLYGRRDFDASTMLARYVRHNAEVRAYFKDRPGDLLVMNMDEGHGWQELCDFVGAPIPDEPYPQAYPALTGHEKHPG